MNQKLPAGWYPILVVAFALSTAFTTKARYFVANRWEIFGVTPNSMNGDPYPNSATEIYSAKICDGFSDQVSSYVQAVNQNFTDVDTYINNYNNNQFPSSVICSLDNQHICVATIQYFNNVTSEATLVDYNYGDYTLD
jgi:hypothetical protein